MTGSQNSRKLRTFGGPPREYVLQEHDSDEAYSYQFITDPFSIDRQSENTYLKYRNLGAPSKLEERFVNLWNNDYKALLNTERFPMYLHYISTIWCESDEVSWLVEDILKIDNIDYTFGSECNGAFVMDESLSPIIKDLNVFLHNGRVIDGDKSPGFEGVVFSKIYQFKIPFFCLLNKAYRDEPHNRIQYIFLADSWGITQFLHHLMLWEDNDDPELLKGVSYKPHVNDFYHKYFNPYVEYSPFPCLVYNDARKSGHVIEVLYWNRVTRKFIFFDPWPFETLLNTYCDINATPSKKIGFNGEKLWEISPTDLEKAVFSVLIPFKIIDMDFLYYGDDSKYFLIPYEKPQESITPRTT